MAAEDVAPQHLIPVLIVLQLLLKDAVGLAEIKKARIDWLIVIFMEWLLLLQKLVDRAHKILRRIAFILIGVG
jgi:hypothetical protein